jgi:hypothetical protein
VFSRPASNLKATLARQQGSLTDFLLLAKVGDASPVRLPQLEESRFPGFVGPKVSLLSFFTFFLDVPNRGNSPG